MEIKPVLTSRKRKIFLGICTLSVCLAGAVFACLYVASRNNSCSLSVAGGGSPEVVSDGRLLHVSGRWSGKPETEPQLSTSWFPVAQAQQDPGRGIELNKDKTLRDYTEGCLRSGCHAHLKSSAWVHAPVSVGSCTPCHTADGAAEKHQFKATRGKEKLCSFCHLAPRAEISRHKAWVDSDCDACHDPHGGATKSLLKSLNEAELCGKCHDATRHPTKADAAPPDSELSESGLSETGLPKTGFSGTGLPDVVLPTDDSVGVYAFLHKPVLENKCSVCHVSHQSKHPHLLVKPEVELCVGCHEPIGKVLETSDHIHKPVSEGCVACHASHGAQNKSLLKDEPSRLCTSCHEDVAKDLADATVTLHGAIREEASCLSCHMSHAGETEKLIVHHLGEACYACHDKEIETQGRVIPSTKTAVEAAEYTHEPVARGECQACHRSHKSPLPHLLDKEHPASATYVAFSKSAYALCFSCHDSDAFAEEKTTKTDFRDGERNLHALHVQKDKGRSCGFCHAVHVSQDPKLMRKKVLFGPGKWELPIDFVETAEGGGCGPGCHKAFTYDNREPKGAPSKAMRRPAKRPDPDTSESSKSSASPVIPDSQSE